MHYKTYFIEFIVKIQRNLRTLSNQRGSKQSGRIKFENVNFLKEFALLVQTE